MEAVADYPGVLALDGGPEAVGSNIKQTYRFLTEKGKAFLDQFDKQNPDEEGE
jgi:hypothetical protein